LESMQTGLWQDHPRDYSLRLVVDPNLELCRTNWMERLVLMVAMPAFTSPRYNMQQVMFCIHIDYQL
jgi:hypothetical protein